MIENLEGIAGIEADNLVFTEPTPANTEKSEQAV